METIEVIQGVSVPHARRPRPSKYPFETMPVGSYFFVPDVVKNWMTVRASAEGRRLKKKFRTRRTTMRETIEGWVLCDPDHEFAVAGIGVWRDQ
jgi:hypothetical protein